MDMAGLDTAEELESKKTILEFALSCNSNIRQYFGFNIKLLNKLQFIYFLYFILMLVPKWPTTCIEPIIHLYKAITLYKPCLFLVSF